MVSNRQPSMNGSTLVIKNGKSTARTEPQSLQQFVINFKADYKAIERSYIAKYSQAKVEKLSELVSENMNEFNTVYVFEFLNLQDQIDWRLIKQDLQNRSRYLRDDQESVRINKDFLGPWTLDLLKFYEGVQATCSVNNEAAARMLDESAKSMLQSWLYIHRSDVDERTAQRACAHLRRLVVCLQYWFDFFQPHNPGFEWWVHRAHTDLVKMLKSVDTQLYERFVDLESPQMGPDPSFGCPPMGRDALEGLLKADMIINSPEYLLEIAEGNLARLERRAIEVSEEMGHGKDWRKAMDHVRSLSAEPGKQAQTVRDISSDVVAFLRQHDMITVSDIAANTWKIGMTSIKGGQSITTNASGDTVFINSLIAAMSHTEKSKMLEDNCLSLTRTDVLHEIIPGHVLQRHYQKRYRRYRKRTSSPCWKEGWSFYWNMILYERGFFTKPEDRLAADYVQMENFARTMVWLKYHLGLMTTRHCVEYLVEKTGVDHSANQAKVQHMLDVTRTPNHAVGETVGALQFYRLRKEIVEGGIMDEKEFHDRIMMENLVHVPLLRCLFKGQSPTQFNDSEPWELDVV